MKDKLPKTADGELIYPGMLLFLVKPFSIEKYSEFQVYGIILDEDFPTSGNQFFIIENRYRQVCDDCGNPSRMEEWPNRLWADKEKCLQKVKEIEDFSKELREKIKICS
jgi:hypothetical protein